MSPAMSTHVAASVAERGVAFRGTAAISSVLTRNPDRIRVVAELLKRSAPSIAEQDGQNAKPAVRHRPSPVGPIIIPVGPDQGPAAPPRPLPPPRPPNTCIGQVCPLPVPYPHL